MSTLQLEACELIEQLSDNKLKLIIDIIKNFSISAEPCKPMVTRRIGVAKGEFFVPDDIDECNTEIAKMFGVES